MKNIIPFFKGIITEDRGNEHGYQESEKRRQGERRTQREQVGAEREGES